jgi:hypothetical protein
VVAVVKCRQFWKANAAADLAVAFAGSPQQTPTPKAQTFHWMLDVELSEIEPATPDRLFRSA